MSERIDIAIVGGGLIGCATALLLAQRSKFNVALFERNQPMTYDQSQSTDDNHSAARINSSNQRVVALGATAISILKEIAVFDELPPYQAHPYTSMTVWDEHSNGELSFCAEEFEQPHLGFMVDAVACTQALQKMVINTARPNLRSYFGCPIANLVFNNGAADFDSNDGKFRAKLVIGADGAQSWVRSKAKIFAQKYDYGQQGLVAKIKTTQSHNDCAWQRFLASGPVAALPLHDNYSSIVWSADNEVASRLISLDDSEFAAELARAFDGKLGEVIELGSRQSFSLNSCRASTYIAPALALIGDAAHSIHPLAGQGANLGFKDALCLTETLTGKEQSKLGSLQVLADYEAKRRRDNEQTDWLMTALNRAYQYDAPWWLSLRGLGMNWINTSPTFKSALARHAMGL